MKYRDVILFFVSIFFLLSLAYAIGVDQRLWFLPTILFVIVIVVVYTLWVK